MKMDKSEAIKYGIPLVMAIVLVSAVIVLGLASQDPDGLEWSLFDFAGVTEPSGGFEGIWSFLGEGMAVDIATGIVGIAAILLLGYGVFWITSRRTK